MWVPVSSSFLPIDVFDPPDTVHFFVLSRLLVPRAFCSVEYIVAFRSEREKLDFVGLACGVTIEDSANHLGYVHLQYDFYCCCTTQLHICGLHASIWFRNFESNKSWCRSKLVISRRVHRKRRESLR